MGILKKLIASFCSIVLIFSLPHVSLASFDDAVAEVNKKAEEGRTKIKQQIEESAKNLNLKKANLEKIYAKKEEYKTKIDCLIKKHETAKTDEEYKLEIDSLKKELNKEQINLCDSREILDSLTAALLSEDDNANDNNLDWRNDDLVASKDMAQRNYNDSLVKVDYLENQLKELKIEQDDFNNFEAKLNMLHQEKHKIESEITTIKKDIEECQKKHDELIAESLSFEENVKNEIYWLEHLDAQNKKNLDDWKTICSGDQCKDNVSDGKAVGNTCGIFAATNVINYFKCIKDSEQPIQGFKDVINNYLNNGGKKENLNNILSFEELNEYLTRSKINVYNLAYEEPLSNLPSLDVAKQEQINNIKEFLKAHFKSNNNSPVLNINGGHWQTFAAYDDIDDKLLLVDSDQAKVEWVDLQVAAERSITISDNKMHWQWLFFSKDKKSDSDFFGNDLERPLTQQMKEYVINKLFSEF